MRRPLASAAALAVSLPLFAARAAAPAASPAPAAAPRLIRIPVWVDSNPSEPSFAIKFEAFINGRPAPIASRQDPSSDLVIIAVLDLTGDISLVDPAKQALADNIKSLPANAWAGILRAQDGLHVLADPAALRKPALDAIGSLNASGTPGLLETIEPAASIADAMLKSSSARVALLYITDGNIYNYREDYTNPVINSSDPHDLSRRFPEALINEKISKLQESLSTLQAPLFIVHIHYRSDRLNEAYQNGLKMLTDETAGLSAVCRSPAEIPDAIHTMFARMLSAWSLSLQLPPKVKENLQLRLTGLRAGQEQHLTWRTRMAWKPK